MSAGMFQKVVAIELKEQYAGACEITRRSVESTGRGNTSVHRGPGNRHSTGSELATRPLPSFSDPAVAPSGQWHSCRVRVLGTAGWPTLPGFQKEVDGRTDRA